MADYNVSLDTETESNQYLTFILDDEEYGVDILRVQEIRGWEAATEIPNMPDFVLGVMNLRGTIVPIIDLRKRFSLEKVEFGSTTVVIVVKVKHEKGERTIGLVVDAVSDVYNISNDDIKENPDFGGAISTDFVKGLATINDRMAILLDIDSLVNIGVLEDVAA